MGRRSITFQAGGEDFEIFKSRLKDWIRLDEIQEKFANTHSPQNILEYLDNATKKPSIFWENLPWIEVLDPYLKISGLNTVELDLPLLTIRDEIKPKPIPWDYQGRGWYVWLHNFASAYNWLPEVIAELEVDDAFALLQEIETDKQLEREWQWQTNELAYPYNKDTKKADFHPLPRPAWMRIKVGPPTKTRIPKRLMPVGNIIDLINNAELISSL
jgi:hypothetical protein